MNYLSMMTKDEIKYACSVIPLQESVRYFKNYPKVFAKVMPGFRATSLRNQEQVSAALFRSRNQPSISSYIERHISRWLEEIKNKVSLITDKGESKESAWLQTLPFCYFVDNIGIFFKLTEEELSEELITLLGQSIRRIKDLDIDGKKIKDSLSKKEQEQVRLKDESKRIQAELEKASKKLIECSVEIKVLKRTNTNLEKLVAGIRTIEQKNAELEKKVKERDETIAQLKARLSVAVNEQQQLEIKIREEHVKQRAVKIIRTEASSKSRCPKDIDEFRDYFGYNLENLGIEASAEYYLLLKDYLCEILFTGKPILISRNTGLSLIKCVSNALVTSPTVATLIFTPEITADAVDEFLSAKNRIMCLDNFIGSFDETILSVICDRHKDKIVFLTVAYDKTLRYVPEEFMKYCHYLNINRIAAFTQARDLTEDPSSVEEIEAIGSMIKPDTLWSPLLKEILGDFGVCSGLSTYKVSHISNEASLCRLLAFDILPYCADVLDVTPFNVSVRLNKYADENGRCPYKELFRRWFS